MRNLVITTVVALLATAVWSADEHEISSRTIRETLAFGSTDGRPRLIVDNVWGDIRIYGHDGSDVRLEVVETIHAESAAKAERAAAEVELEIRTGGGEVDLFVAGPFRDARDRRRWAQRHRHPGYTVVYDFELHVPRRCDLDVRTVTDGEVEIHGVSGTYEVRNVNGGIQLERGSADRGIVETVNGPIIGRFDGIPAGELRFATVNGRIEVVYPPSLAADLRLKSGWGEIWSEFEVAPLPQPPPTRRQENGRLVIKVGGGAAVRVGTGGPQVFFETLNGDILIRKEGHGT